MTVQEFVDELLASAHPNDEVIIKVQSYESTNVSFRIRFCHPGSKGTGHKVVIQA